MELSNSKVGFAQTQLWLVCLGQRSSVPAACGWPKDQRLHFPPGCLGCRFQVDDWGRLTPAHDSRSPVLLPINDLLQGY